MCCRYILASLLESNISCYKLMTGSVSTYVLQKLITMLPGPLLEPLITEVEENFLKLCLDSVGCRLVQVLLENSSEDQQLRLLSLLSQPEVLLSLATSPSGTFVAQVSLGISLSLRLLTIFSLPGRAASPRSSPPQDGDSGRQSPRSDLAHRSHPGRVFLPPETDRHPRHSLPGQSSAPPHQGRDHREPGPGKLRLLSCPVTWGH